MPSSASASTTQRAACGDALGSMVELGYLLPTYPRRYFTSAPELPFRGGCELDLATAWWCAEASMLAYQDSTRICELAGEADGWTVSNFGHSGSAFAILLKSNDAAILAFRGTRVGGFETLQDAIFNPINIDDFTVDARFIPTRFQDIARVHGGILASFTDFWAAHQSDIVQAAGDTPLVLTGHSLGAGLATIALASGSLPTVTALYSFGSPRVGNAAFRRHLAAQSPTIHRFVHGMDFVTSMAPERFLGYTHVGDALYLRHDASEISRHAPTLLSRFTRALRLTWPALKGFFANSRRLRKPVTFQVPADAMADHAPVYYVEKIRTLALAERGTL